MESMKENQRSVLSIFIHDLHEGHGAFFQIRLFVYRDILEITVLSF